MYNQVNGCTFCVLERERERKGNSTGKITMTSKCNTIIGEYLNVNRTKMSRLDLFIIIDNHSL